MCFRKADHFGDNQSHEEDQLDEAHNDPGHQEGGTVLWSELCYQSCLSSLINFLITLTEKSNCNIKTVLDFGTFLCTLVKIKLVCSPS